MIDFSCPGDIYITCSAVAGALGSRMTDVADALFAQRTAFALPGHFDSHGKVLGIDPDLNDFSAVGSRALLLARKLRAVYPGSVPPDTVLFLATTVGAVELTDNETDGCQLLLEELKKLFCLKQAVLVSAACASGQLAAQCAVQHLAKGECDHALVVGLDIASEFVFSGFSALGAVSPSVCSPYDAGRNGLTLGEAAAALFFERGGNAIGRITACGSSCDAAHITAPDLSGRFLSAALQQALQKTDICEIGGIIGHGTGTSYNDTAELNALRTVFPEIPPLYSLKGHFGHTLGATGVLQLALALEFSRRGMIPGQTGLQTPDELAGNAVSPETQQCSGRKFLTVNAGFGGLNSVLQVTNL